MIEYSGKVFNLHNSIGLNVLPVVLIFFRRSCFQFIGDLASPRYDCVSKLCACPVNDCKNAVYHDRLYSN